MKIILGSGSKFRQNILKEMGIEFDVMTADIDEKVIRHEDPEQLTLALAHAKADELIKRITEPALLITADEVVVWNGEVREKPESEEQARAFLKSYSEHPAVTCSSVVVTNTATGNRAGGVDFTHSWYMPLTEEAIDLMIAKGDVMYSSGALIAEDSLMKQFLIHMEGTWDSEAGLPKKLVEQFLKEVQE